MASPEPLLEKFNEIPDPAGFLGDRPAPEAAAPAAKAPEEPSPTRADRRLRALLALAVALAWTGFVLFHLRTRADIGAVNVVAPLVVWLGSAALGLVLVFRRGERGLPAGVRVVQAIAVALPLLFLGVAAIVTAGSERATPFSWKTLSPCMVWSAIAGVGPIAAAALLLRRSFLSAPVWRGAAVGAACGLTASVLIHAHCAAPGASHVLVAHGFPAVCGALVGGLLGALGGRA